MSLGDGIPWAIAVGGWLATHVFSEGRERRKEVRAQIDKIHVYLSTFEIAARSFHAATSYDAKITSDLRAKINVLERLLMRVPPLSMDDLHPYTIAIRRSATLQNFEPSTFISHDYDTELAQGITSAVQEMEDELERQYIRRYPNRFPYVWWWKH